MQANVHHYLESCQSATNMNSEVSSKPQSIGFRTGQLDAAKRNEAKHLFSTSFYGRKVSQNIIAATQCVCSTIMCTARSRTLRKLVFHYLPNWMGSDRGDSFPFDFEPNGVPFGSKSKGKLPRSDPIQFERKWNTSFLSAWLLKKCTSHRRNEHQLITTFRAY